jgi:DNA-binding response OmpR family regulator
MVAESVRVLLVEDDIEVSRAIARMLTQAGFNVIVTPTRAATEALACKFSVGVFDIDLTDGSGVELAARLVDDGQVDNAVFFSATTSPSTLMSALEVGPVVAKRDGADALIGVVRSALRHQRVSRSMIVPAAVPDAVQARKPRRLNGAG